MGRGAGADASDGGALSGSRIGKLKSGLGSSSMGPALDRCRLWYSGEPMPASWEDWLTCCRGRAIEAMLKQLLVRQDVDGLDETQARAKDSQEWFWAVASGQRVRLRQARSRAVAGR